LSGNLRKEEERSARAERELAEKRNEYEKLFREYESTSGKSLQYIESDRHKEEKLRASENKVRELMGDMESLRLSLERVVKERNEFEKENVMLATVSNEKDQQIKLLSHGYQTTEEDSSKKISSLETQLDDNVQKASIFKDKFEENEVENQELRQIIRGLNDALRTKANKLEDLEKGYDMSQQKEHEYAGTIVRM